MNSVLPVCLAMALFFALPANAQQASAVPGNGLSEIPEPELNLMRGRYTVGGNAVAWFGVTMISTWQTADARQLQGALTFGMDFSKGGAPRISFTPSVSITAADAALPVSGQRSVDAAGVANVSGFSQTIQVAGDRNAASNVMHLNVRNDGRIPIPGTDSENGTVSAASGTATATAGFDGRDANVSLQVEGQGAVQQWLRSGSVGQSIQLMADGQQAGNRLQIDLVRQSLGSNMPLAQNVAQAITLARGIGGVAGQ